MILKQLWANKPRLMLENIMYMYQENPVTQRDYISVPILCLAISNK